MKQISFFPAINTIEELSDIISRSAWHFSFLKNAKYVIYTNNLNLNLDQLVERKGFDEAVFAKVNRFIKKIELMSSDLITSDAIAASSSIIKWKEDDKELNAFLAKHAKCTIYRTDPKLVRHEGSFYIQCAFDSLTNKDELIAQSQTKFKKLYEKLGFFAQSWVLATGPCIEKYKEHDFSTALTVVCNSTILDDELINHCKPKIVVFADPIFHFGVSKYAGEFRKTLKYRLETSDISVIVPLKYYSLLLAIFPEYVERIIGVPFRNDIDFNSDISKKFEVKTTANILTLLLLPVGATFSNTVNILGCDGRSFDDDSYFWSHGKSVQINNKMQNIQDVHPGFFEIDYNEYYYEHCHLLECQLTRGESFGKKYIHHAQSFIPALRDRNEKFRIESKFSDSHCLILEPDGVGESGHYVTWHNQLISTILKRENQVTLLCNKQQNSNLYLTNAINTFTSHSWGISRSDWCLKKDFSNHKSFKLFFDELKQAIDDYCKKSLAAELTLFIYFGSVQILSGLHSIRSQFKKKNIEINISLCLFHEAVILNDDIVEPRLPPNAKEILFEALAQSDSYKITSQTKRLANNIYDRISVLTDMMPHPIPAGMGVNNQANLLKSNNKFRIVFPCALRNEKGGLLTKRFIEDVVNSDIDSTGFEFVVREIDGVSIDNIDNIEWIKEGNSEDEYRQLLNSADAIVIPYLSPQFTFRTSGIIVDAMYAKKPIVVIEGTWLADIAKEYHAGLVIRPYTSYSILSALKVIKKNESQCAKLVNNSFTYFENNNNWERLIEVMLDR